MKLLITLIISVFLLLNLVYGNNHKTIKQGTVEDYRYICGVWQHTPPHTPNKYEELAMKQSEIKSNKDITVVYHIDCETKKLFAVTVRVV